LAQINAAAVASRSRMPPAASILAKQAKGLVITSMGGRELDRRSVDKERNLQMSLDLQSIVTGTQVLID
jgi:hypothetical protein